MQASLDNYGVEQLLAAVDASTKKAKETRRNDEVFMWVRDNWKLFAVSRSHVNMAVDEADTSFGHTEDGLASALGLPANVFLVRGKAENVKASSLLSLGNSELMKVFREKQEQAKSQDLTVVYIAGRSSVVITSAQTACPDRPFSEAVYTERGSLPVKVFPAGDLNERLPQIHRLGEQ